MILMKKITLALITSILLLGCGTKKPKVENNEISIIKQELDHQMTLAKNSSEELQKYKDDMKEKKKAWNEFNLMVIKLDKNKKPTISKNLEIIDVQDSFTFSTGPKITISPFSTINNDGKIIQFNCKTSDVKQKFESAMNLTGWTLEMSCGKDSYFFIINKK